MAQELHSLSSLKTTDSLPRNGSWPSLYNLGPDRAENTVKISSIVVSHHYCSGEMFIAQLHSNGWPIWWRGNMSIGRYPATAFFPGFALPAVNKYVTFLPHYGCSSRVGNKHIAISSFRGLCLWRLWSFSLTVVLALLAPRFLPVSTASSPPSSWVGSRVAVL
jgi:hypothetical protein